MPADKIYTKLGTIFTKMGTGKLALFAGSSTFFFGFGAGALYNYYLILTNSPLFRNLRTSLTFQSAIYGDGIILPFVNITAALFLKRNSKYITPVIFKLALISGAVVTAYFHISQAVGGLVNWAMPAPWQWNFLGLWHALYMFSVASFLSFFYFTAVKITRIQKKIPFQALFITAALVLFFILLDFDYR